MCNVFQYSHVILQKRVVKALFGHQVSESERLLVLCTLVVAQEDVRLEY